MMVPIKLQPAIQSSQQISGIHCVEETVDLLVSKMAGEFPREITDDQLVTESGPPVTFELTQSSRAKVIALESANHHVCHQFG
jgi:hypothetical protein